ncbi:Iars1 [Symbiodinium natans]|uniref:isoleucine--tRNA ligase n=1 Tax=Symbiodinium natans TaxID=878477 RepID=A0A812UFE8_9DINO|nr:Iars1 [Symbiodinium natans]
MVYRAFRVMPYSTACATPLSNFEVSQNYKEVSDPSIIVQFKLKNEENSFVLAWTTTPWTLPSNVALCVNPELTYLQVENTSTHVKWIVGKDRWPWICSSIKKNAEKDFKILWSKQGKELKGLKYEPLFDYFKGKARDEAWQIVSDGYVSTEAGTCIVHQAPAFGEDDNRVCLGAGIIQKDGSGMVCPIDDDGRFTDEVPDFKGKHVKEADKDIKEKLKKEGKLVFNGTEVHNYPHCWRSDTPLIYRAVLVQSMLQIGVGQKPALIVIYTVLLPIALFTSWRLRYRLDDRFPHIWDDARASNSLQLAMYYAIVAFHLLPLLLWGSGQEAAESLVLNVGGYFGVFLILLDNHMFATLLITLYAAAAFLKALVARASFTEGLIHQSLLTIAWAGVARFVLYRVDRYPHLKKILQDSPPSRRERSCLWHFETLIDIVSHREGRKSLAKVLSVYRLRQDRKEGLIAQFFWMYYATTTCRLPKNILQRIFFFLDSSEPSFPVPAASLASAAVVSSLDATQSQGSVTSALTSVAFLRKRLLDTVFFSAD